MASSRGRGIKVTVLPWTLAVVGPDEELYSTELTATSLNWIAGAPPSAEFRAEAKIRYAAEPSACSATLEGGRLRLVFDQPQRAIAPGQSVVLYDGEVVLGGGTIGDRPRRRNEPK